MSRVNQKNPTHSPRHSEQLFFAMNHLVFVIQQLSLAKDLQSIVDIVRVAARQLTGADGATIVLRENDSCYYIDEDAIGPLWKGKRFPIEACISGWAMINKKSVIIPDIYADARIPIDAYRPTFVKSMVMVPIRSNSPIGAIGNYWASHHDATNDEVKLLQALADSTSIAIENENLYTNLKKNITEITKKEEDYRLLSEHLQTSLDEKEVLLKEIYHRVKNNLQVVSSLLSLQTENSDKVSKSVLLESIKRINTMAMIHEMLYQSDNKSMIHANEYVKNLLHYLCRVSDVDLNVIKVSTEIDEVVLTIDKSIPFGLIINELVTNAFKHAFTSDQGGEILLLLKNNNKNVKLIVKDNGCGIKSLADISPASIGLSLVSNLVKQLKGKIDIKSQVGTEVEIDFPVS